MSNFQSGEFQLESLTIVNSEKESVDLSTDLDRDILLDTHYTNTHVFTQLFN